MMCNFHVFSRFIIVLSGLLVFSNCSKPGDTDDEDVIGNWIRASDFDGYARSEAVTFVINNKAYLTSGASDRERFNDLWEYDLAQQYWTQKADLPSPRNSAVGFAIDGKGYITTGYDGNSRLKETWEYNPADNNWYRKKDFSGTARVDAVGFSIGGKGYLCAGFDGNYLKDLWEYDPVTDNWTQRASIGGSKRSAAQCFVIEGKAYICSGSNNGAALNDLWMYDPNSNSWTEKRKISNVSDETYDDKYSNITRSNGIAFTLAKKGYVTVGENGSLINETWEYDPSKDLWIKKTPFEGSGRTGAVAFTLQDRAFILSGRSGSLSFDNMYEFKPGDKQNKYD